MNETLKGKRLLIVGLTLFSMFFGAGNLIFPSFLAAQAGCLAGHGGLSDERGWSSGAGSDSRFAGRRA